MGNGTLQPDEQDSPWKKVLRLYFREALDFFFPEIAQGVDWTKPIEFLDKELLKLAPTAVMGKRYADQLVKLHHNQGPDIYLLIHVEIQAVPEKGFAKRIDTYSFRIFDYFDRHATSIAILCDGKPDWRPSRYSVTQPGTTLNFEFSTVKLLDYRDRWAELERSQNPFAWVVMAHLKMQETRRNKASRKDWKLRLIRSLCESGYNKTDVLNLFNFIDWILGLPKALEIEFWRELQAYEEERKVPYISSVERIGYDRGLHEGEEKGQRSLILRLLSRKVGVIDEHTLDRINALSIDQLESLGEALLDFGSIDDLANWLNHQG
ncbi:DUF4351 domain-containing protein [Alkalinema pantanalense CENA528]|uniref:DUF4351 domain-containing protein n=1 Tax=Alkalinema pantanalense TaxID=1620705 RepID=UPI003D6FAF4C